MNTMHDAQDVADAAPNFFESIKATLKGAAIDHFVHDEDSGDLAAAVPTAGGEFHLHPLGNVGEIFPPKHLDGPEQAAAKAAAKAARDASLAASQAASADAAAAKAARKARDAG
jgi:hypothetical protein